MSSPKLYALLVGINEYQTDQFDNLAACVGDVLAIETLLRGRFKEENCFIQKLTDAKAKKAAIIHGFENHLCQAGPDDFVLFYYSGHGGTEKTPPEFKDYNPSPQIETIVCHDSRHDEWDLADKEMAKLLEKVSAKKPHITVIMDCCHSGSGTRGKNDRQYKKRQVPLRPDKRPIDSFYGYAPGGSYFPPHSDHILLSACRNTELAREAWIDTGFRGIFSYCLTTVLNENPDISYVDLFLKAESLLEKEGLIQHPSFQTVGTVDPFNGFLSRKRNPGENIMPLVREARSWYINKGFLNFKHFDFKQAGHGLKVGIYEADDEVNEDNLLKITTSAKIKSGRTYINFPRVLNPSKKYKAAIISFPSAPFLIQVEDTEASMIKTIEGLLAKTSLNVKFTNLEESSDYKLVLDGDAYMLYLQPDNLLIQGAKGIENQAAGHIVKQLLKICNWHWLQDFQHPNFEDNWLPGSFKTEDGDPLNFSPETIDFKLEVAGKTITSEDEEFILETTEGETIDFRTIAQNNSGEEVHINHLILHPDYAVEKQSDQFQNADPKVFSEGQLNMTGHRDEEVVLFKIIASKELFPELFKTQDGIRFTEIKKFKIDLGPLRSSAESDSAMDWFSKTIKVRLRRC